MIFFFNYNETVSVEFEFFSELGVKFFVIYVRNIGFCFVY